VEYRCNIRFPSDPHSEELGFTDIARRIEN
jgi:hypothetical protein